MQPAVPWAPLRRHCHGRLSPLLSRTVDHSQNATIGPRTPYNRTRRIAQNGYIQDSGAQATSWELSLDSPLSRRAILLRPMPRWSENV